MSQSDNQAKAVCTYLHGVLSEQTKELQTEVETIIAEIKTKREGHPEAYPIAIAIIGAELSAEE